MRKHFSRLIAALTIVISTFVTLGFTIDDAEARRMGGGSSFGRQSSNVMQKRAPAQAPSAQQNATPNASQATANRGAAAGATAQRSGFSRFLGPLAGIAAGLGIMALLSSLGLSGAFLEFLSSAILIAIVIFGIMFIVRRLRGGQAKPATQGAFGGQNRQAQDFFTNRQGNDYSQSQAPAQPAESIQGRVASVFNRNPASASQQPFAADATATQATAAQPLDPSWYVPEGFDITTFLTVAKQQFVSIQGLWDKGDVEQLKDYLTDDLVSELSPQILEQANQGGHSTEVVLLNAELLGMEQVAGGHLASIRFSGMLREEAGQEAFRFEEVWNLYKTADSGWLLAGIQQIPEGYQS